MTFRTLPIAILIIGLTAGCAVEEKKQDAVQAKPVLSADEHIAQAKEHISEAKLQLKKDGEYSCCISPSCDQCALDHQSCPCGDGVQKGNSVCSECYAGWQRGEGKFQDIDPEHVKTSVSSHRH